MTNQNENIVDILASLGPAQRLSIILNRMMSENKIDGVQLSKKTGIPVTTINRLRKCDPDNNPTLSTLIPLADFFSLTISQLIGDDPIKNVARKKIRSFKPTLMKHLPLLTWQEASIWPETSNRHHTTISSDYDFSENSFALLVEEDYWESLSSGTALLIDPTLTIQPRDYILVHKLGQPAATLKQALFDENLMYLKPMITGYNLAPLTPEHRIIGVVVEFKKSLKKPIESEYIFERSDNDI